MEADGERMKILSNGDIANIIDEISDTAEVNRRALAKRRHDVYKDGGKAFLVEKILREFGQDSLAEMRIAPINLLKKIVDKRASIYKRAPTRTATNPQDQILVDYYAKEMCLDEVMAKANRYLVLAANTMVYIRPYEGKLKATVVPSYQYSIVPDQFEKCEPEVVIFSAYVDEGRVSPQAAPFPGTGVESFSEQRQDKLPEDLVDSNEKETLQKANQYIFWSEYEHFTTNDTGQKYTVAELGPEQFYNPIGKMPVVNVARDRDNEIWATQGEDMIDLTMSLQLGWSDVLTVAKHQGFSLLTVTSEEEPKKLTFGINKAIWLKSRQDGPQPSIGYVQASSPLAEYKDLLGELLALLLTTNNMDPGSIGGKGNTKTFTSGFHALISMADALEAIESDKPLMKQAEEESWEVISAWHNWMYDMSLLEPEAMNLGRFSEEFEINIQYADIKPIESEDERIARVKTLMDMGLLTRTQAIKKLHPDMTDEMVIAYLAEIDAEKQSNLKQAQDMFGGSSATQEGLQQQDGEQEYQNGDEVRQAAEASSGDSAFGEEEGS